MSVYRHKGQVYIVMGGNQATTGSSDPREILIFPFVPSTQNIKLKDNSFTVNGVRYKIARFLSIPMDTKPITDIMTM